jgi:hypothetical protein
MKILLTLSVITLLSCKTAFVSDYSFQRPLEGNDCYYAIELNEPSFFTLTPITNTYSHSVLVDDQWVSTDDEEVVGYGIRNESYNSFLYLMEEGLNQHRFVQTCGLIHVTRIQHEMNQDFHIGFSALTLFIPNIFGMPLKVSKVRNTYLFEVYNPEDHLIYRAKHSGEGKAKLGFYYGYINAEEKADYEATYRAIEDFVGYFRNEVN